LRFFSLRAPFFACCPAADDCQHLFPPTIRPSSTPPSRLILASSSAYRRELLERLRLPFEVDDARHRRTPAARRSAGSATALRLARAKAAAVAPGRRAALVIGSDQVATLDGEQIGKPGNHANALAQLRGCAAARHLPYRAVPVGWPRRHRPPSSKHPDLRSPSATCPTPSWTPTCASSSPTIAPAAPRTRARHRHPRTHRQQRPDRPHRPAPDRPDRHAAQGRRHLLQL
jgi:hypothetical protein